MSNFSLENGDAGKAFLSLAKTVFVFIFMPLSLYALFTGVVDSASAGGGFLNPGTLDQMKTVIDQLIRKAIKYAIPFLIISVPLGFYPRGNAAKIPFRMAWAFYMAVWIWILAEGGSSTALSGLSLGTVAIDSFRLNLDLTHIMYISLMVCITKGFLAFSEYGSYHEEYLESLESKGRKDEAGL